MLVYLKRVTFDHDTVRCISIEETEKSIDIVMYLDNSRHVLHRIDLTKSNDYADIVSAELIKEFYDQLMVEMYRRVKSNQLSKNGENFKHYEKELDKIVNNFKNWFITNEEYNKLSNDRLNVETLEEAFEIRDKIDELSQKIYNEAVYAIDRLFK